MNINNMNHHNNHHHNDLALNDSGADSEKMLKSIAILKSVNDEILNTVVDRLTLADDNVTRLAQENENLRQLLQEMNDHEPKMKEELMNAVKAKEASFAMQLEQKEQEIEKWRNAYEEASK